MPHVTGAQAPFHQVFANFVVFFVSDDGPGIHPDLHERAFRMFATLRPRSEVEGSGMGLALVKRVIEGVGGDITLESAEGEGTTFIVTWPQTST